MKNITLSIDEKVLAAARHYAAERNASVNALVREYLADIARQENRAARPENALSSSADNRKRGSARRSGAAKTCMSVECFLDSNILVYAAAAGEPEQEKRH